MRMSEIGDGNLSIKQIDEEKLLLYFVPVYRRMSGWCLTGYIFGRVRSVDGGFGK